MKFDVGSTSVRRQSGAGRGLNHAAIVNATHTGLGGAITVMIALAAFAWMR